MAITWLILDLEELLLIIEVQSEILASLPAIHNRHIEVHKNKIELWFCCFDDFNCFIAILSRNDPYIQIFKHELDLHHLYRIIIDNQGSQPHNRMIRSLADGDFGAFIGNNFIAWGKIWHFFNSLESSGCMLLLFQELRIILQKSASWRFITHRDLTMILLVVLFKLCEEILTHLKCLAPIFF